MSETINLTIGAVALLSLVGVIVGLALCTSYEWRQTGKQTAFTGLALFIFVFGFAFFEKRSAESKATALAAAVADQAQQGANQPAPAVPTYQDVLSKLRVTGVSNISTKRTGNAWNATFMVHNDSNIAIKDVRVTCEQLASSGTPIGRSSRTLYEIVGRRSYIAVNSISLGYRHSEATQSKCYVIGFSFI